MNEDQGAAAALVDAVMAALRGVPGLSQVSDGAPLQAADAHAIVEAGPEIDWGHKSGAGAEIRFAMLVGCGGEAPGRARMLLQRARIGAEAIGPELGSPAHWRLASLAMMRSRVVRAPGGGWTGSAEYRARMLRL
jgi:hypothetical protein